MGGPIKDRLRQLGCEHVFEVQFGACAPDRKCANMAITNAIAIVGGVVLKRLRRIPIPGRS